MEDPEPTQSFKSFHQIDAPSKAAENDYKELIFEVDSLTMNEPSIILIGLTIAIATFGIPITAVLTERPFAGEKEVPAALKNNGSKPSRTITITRIGESSSGNSRWE